MLGSFQVLPRLIGFDLDYTLWPFYWRSFRVGHTRLITFRGFTGRPEFPTTASAPLESLISNTTPPPTTAFSKAASVGSSEWVQQMLAVVDEMEKAGVRGSISTANILIGALGGCEVERCMKLVHKWGLKLNAYTLKCILQSHLRSYESDKAYGVYLEMRRKGYKLDIFAYNMLLDALAKDDKVLQEKNVRKEDLKARALALKLLGKIFQHACIQRGKLCLSIESSKKSITDIKEDDDSSSDSSEEDLPRTINYRTPFLTQVFRFRKLLPTSESYDFKIHG